MLLYIIFFVAGSLAVDSLIPDLPSEPGMVSPEAGLLIMGALNAMLIIVLIESSRYHGWKLAFGLCLLWRGNIHHADRDMVFFNRYHSIRRAAAAPFYHGPAGAAIFYSSRYPAFR